MSFVKDSLPIEALLRSWPPLPHQGDCSKVLCNFHAVDTVGGPISELDLAAASSADSLAPGPPSEPPEEETGQADLDRPRMGRPPQMTQTIGSQADDGPSWSQWDLGKALKVIDKKDDKINLKKAMRNLT